MKSFLLWCLASVIAVATLSVGFAHLPPGLRRLVFQYLLFGAASGFALRWLARELDCRLSMAAILCGCLLILAGGLNIGRVSSQQFHTARKALMASQKEQLAALGMLEQIAANDPAMLAQYEAERRKYNPNFDDYLTHRASAIGKGEWIAPRVVWGIELVAALLAGASVMASTLLTSQSSGESQTTTTIAL